MTNSVTNFSPDLSAALDAVTIPARIPRATYRVQFNADFTFRDAQAIVPYLRRLGVSHLYASPIFQARPGSTHGYDICDYSRLNEVLGTDEDFDALVSTLNAHDMGLIVDIVPNHMGIGTDCNQWWVDVLENGPSSRYAGYFDITWSPVKHELEDKVLLPVLEDQYGAELESGKFQLGYEDGQFFVQYNTIWLPLMPDTYVPILQEVVAHLGDLSENEELQELQSIVTALQHLPSYQERDPEQRELRHREKEIIKRRIRLLAESSEVIRVGIQHVLTALNGTAGEPESFDRLEAILTAQPYRIAFWRVASDEINYRRFFDINEMAAIRVEQPEVFEAVHSRVRQMIEARQLDGLRIDHPDGLWDPSAYFIGLQRLYLKARLKDTLPEDQVGEALDALVQQWLDTQQAQPSNERVLPFYVLVEKILSETEPLPTDWWVHGTTGYDFLNQVNGLFVKSASEKRLDEIYQRFIQPDRPFADLIYNAKILIMEKSLSSEIRSLSHELERITEMSRRYRDFTLAGLTQAIREIIASMSIYRTYITDAESVSDRDRRYILEAVVNARLRNPSISRLLFSFIRDTLLLHNLDQFSPENRQRIINFVMKFQQLTGPVMAKSVEDTVFYMYNRLISLNEVGGHPEQLGISIESFHAQNRTRSQTWPHSMLASSTHDTKRSEDVRARINVLSEMPDEWEAAVQRWAKMNADKKTTIAGQVMPDANDEYLYYQTLVGIWESRTAEPTDDLRDRLTAYMTKAANEAKVHTSWLDQDEEYIAALGQFIHQTLDDTDFLNDFIQLQQRVAFYGQINALSQTLLKLTSPGVPDIYQGTEGWHLALVDPDNRRAVDFSRYGQMLDEIGDGTHAVTQMLEGADDGRIKLYTHAAVLNLRRQHPALLEHGSYEPLYVEGPLAEHVCAFARRHEDIIMIVAVPRLVMSLTQREIQLPVGDGIWQETMLSLSAMGTGQDYRNLFTDATLQPMDGRLPLADVFRDFPIAVLVAGGR